MILKHKSTVLWEKFPVFRKGKNENKKIEDDGSYGFCS
jgi:hypothetical protein